MAEDKKTPKEKKDNREVLDSKLFMIKANKGFTSFTNIKDKSKVNLPTARFNKLYKVKK